MPAEDLEAGLAVAADADAQRGLADPLELELEVVAGALVEVLGLDEPLARDQSLHRSLGPLVADHDEPPRLHQADRRRLVGGLQQSRQQRIVERLGTETADVAPLRDRAPDAGAGGLVEPAGRRIGGALARAGVVELGRQRRALEAHRMHSGGSGGRWGLIAHPRVRRPRRASSSRSARAPLRACRR
ncbi:MAG: hypothetical protein ABSG43_26735 [Solirubrobacteraceae bacterium]